MNSIERTKIRRFRSGLGVYAGQDIPEGTIILTIDGTAYLEAEKYTLQAGESYHIYADGQDWKFLNHSCDPNCCINFGKWDLIAARNIIQGEELTMNYLTTEWDMAQPFDCECGSDSCFGHIQGFRCLPLSSQMNLLPGCSPYLISRFNQKHPLIVSPHAFQSYSDWRPAVYVFIPYLMKDGRMMGDDYDLPSYRAEVQSWFEELGMAWRWVPITIDSVGEIVERLAVVHSNNDIVVVNLCDGNEIDLSPGLSVVRALEKAGIPFTGAAPEFYEITTFKVPMKERFVQSGVRTAPFIPIRDPETDIPRIEEHIGYPVIIKPEVSAASGGISLKSLVSDAVSARGQVGRLLADEWGEYYRSTGIFAEKFINGPEFTVFLIADRDEPSGAYCFPAVQRVFHSALPANERFLSYDRYWSFYKEESRLPEGEPFYRYAVAPEQLQQKLTALAVRAFFAVSGTGYARVDIRMEKSTDELYVLEVNSNCGLSGDRETSVGEITHVAGVPMHALISRILRAAYQRFFI